MKPEIHFFDVVQSKFFKGGRYSWYIKNINFDGMHVVGALKLLLERCTYLDIWHESKGPSDLHRPNAGNTDLHVGQGSCGWIALLLIAYDWLYFLFEWFKWMLFVSIKVENFLLLE